MEHDGIFVHDYVIIEYFARENDWPKERELIVTKYIKLSDAILMEEALETPNEEDFQGPTLKTYHETIEYGRKIYELGWKKGNDKNPDLIRAAIIEPIARVIGIYRPIK